MPAMGQPGVPALQRGCNSQWSVFAPEVGGCCGCVVLIRTGGRFMKFRVRPSALPALSGGPAGPCRLPAQLCSSVGLAGEGTGHSCGIPRFPADLSGAKAR